MARVGGSGGGSHRLYLAALCAVHWPGLCAQCTDCSTVLCALWTGQEGRVLDNTITSHRAGRWAGYVVRLKAHRADWKSSQFPYYFVCREKFANYKNLNKYFKINFVKFRKPRGNSLCIKLVPGAMLILSHFNLRQTSLRRSRTLSGHNGH